MKKILKKIFPLFVLSLILVGIYSFANLTILVLFITVFLTFQGYLVTRAMLHGFTDNEDSITPTSSPFHSFSLIVPARNEEGVIGNTITSLANLNYPKELYEVLVMVRADDYQTLVSAQKTIDNLECTNIRLVQIDGDADNKAYSLNIGSRLAKHSYLGIFDAEDEPARNILQAINSKLLDNPTIKAVQAPVHLVNLNSSWFSSLNAVEYYFWFRSVLPYLSLQGVIPLGGNTIFLEKNLLNKLGNYDESCLTEDADLGVRLAASNIPVSIISDPSLATEEETPEDELGVIYQRSRWDQGYLQVLAKGQWRQLGIRQKFYILYTLTQPIFRHLSFLNMIFSPLLASSGYVPLWVAIFSFIPGYFLLLQLGLYLMGIADLARLHQIKVGLGRYLSTLLAFIPYQALLALATTRAVIKIIFGNYSWDKTTHTNAHREGLAILET